MRRGLAMWRSAPMATTFTALGALCQRRPFAVAPTRLLRNGPGKSAADEDREELERERRLREQFAQKIQQGMPSAGEGTVQQQHQQQHQHQHQQQPGFGGFPFGPQGGGGAWANPAGLGAQRTGAQQFARLTFFVLSFFMLLSLGTLADRNSPAYTMQGLPWWELPITSAAYFLLLRALYPMKDQRRIQEEFETAARANPRLSFDQFMAHRYPNMFDGYRSAQPEVVAAVAAVLASATDLTFAKTMVRAAGRAKDTRASADDILDALRRDYPQIF